jgi:uncharacterized membrane protein
MGFSVLGAIVILTGWFALVEYDQQPEDERKKILERIKQSPLAIAVIALMPLGLLINMIGTIVGSITVVTIGSTLVFIQSIIVSLLFWKRKRWKSIVLLIGMLVLGGVMYLPLFVHT